MIITLKQSVSCSKCAHAHSTHVRNFALKGVACEYHSFQIAHKHSGEFWGEYGCFLLREKILMVRGRSRQLGGVGGCSGGGRRWRRRRLTSSTQRNEARDTPDRDAAPSRSSVRGCCQEQCFLQVTENPSSKGLALFSSQGMPSQSCF